MLVLMLNMELIVAPLGRNPLTCKPGAFRVAVGLLSHPTISFLPVAGCRNLNENRSSTSLISLVLSPHLVCHRTLATEIFHTRQSV